MTLDPRLLALALLLAPLPAQAEPAQAVLLWGQRLLSTVPTISGRVLSADGQPVAGAAVAARRHPEGPAEEEGLAEARADGAGRFRLLLAAGSQALSIHAPGFLPGRVQGLAVAPGRPVTGLEVRLVRGAVLLGRVLDEAGAPVAGASVGIPDGDGLLLEALSDPTGRYRLDGIEPGEREVWIRHDCEGVALSRVQVAPGINRLDLTLVRCAVRGRVLDPDGAPVTGAQVLFQGSKSANMVTTGGDGAFAFRAAEGWGRLDVTTHGYIPYHSRIFRVRGAAAQDIEVRLTRGGALYGRIDGLSTGGRQIQVSAFNEETGESDGPGTAADAEGRYRLVGLRPGIWQVTASVDRRWTAGKVTLKPDVAEVRLDLTFPAYWPVRGRVVDGDGAPVAGASVFLHSGKDPQGSTESGADGTFALELPDGVYELLASAKGYAPAVLADPVTVRGAPVDGVEVRLAAQGEEDGFASRYGVPDRQGAFQLTGLRPGRYRLEVQDFKLYAVGGRPSYDQVIDLTEDRELEIELPGEPEAGPGVTP